MKVRNVVSFYGTQTTLISMQNAFDFYLIFINITRLPEYRIYRVFFFKLEFFFLNKNFNINCIFMYNITF